MPVPDLSDAQRHSAREVALAARSRRAEAKQRLRRGEDRLADVLAAAEADDVLAHLRVVDLLRCLPRVGPVRAAAIMERFDIAANRRVRGLGRHQVSSLVAEFG